MVTLGKVFSLPKPWFDPCSQASPRAQEMKRFLLDVAHFCASGASHSEANPVSLRGPVGTAVVRKVGTQAPVERNDGC